ncbi:ion transporter [Herbidospora mongoliensis]|uniref:ion transporter n=1 Tax=Herbidospora mongoliensis TaxID=688067 RepID=UPI000829FCAA|nr:ion transporter [Herbidospora mongoliensis]
MRERVRYIIEAKRFQQAIIAIILINSATLGVETSAAAVARYGDILHLIDRVSLAIFVVELAARLYVQRGRFLRDPWNVFDSIVVAVSLMPAAGGLTVLRSLRVLRALRLVSAIPSLRRVVGALLTAVPGVASIAALLGLVLYVAAVMGTRMYGHVAPDYFGNLQTSLFTLFQIMTGDGWSDITRQVMTVYPSAWVFFVIFVLICTFVVVNLFIAVVVSAMDEEEVEVSERILAELAELRKEVRELREPAASP